jgi:hypothetical protein
MMGANAPNWPEVAMVALFIFFGLVMVRGWPWKKDDED